MKSLFNFNLNYSSFQLLNFSIVMSHCVRGKKVNYRSTESTLPIAVLKRHFIKWIIGTKTSKIS